MMMRGRLYTSLHEKEKAMEWHEKAIATMTEIADGKKESPFLFPFLQAIIADYKELGEEEKA